MPVAAAGIDDCLVGVLRWVTAGKRVAGCADFILRQIADGIRVFLHGPGPPGRLSAPSVSHRICVIHSCITAMGRHSYENADAG